MRKTQQIKLSKKERDYLFGLLQIIQTEFEADKALGCRVNKKEEKLIASLINLLKPAK